MSKTSDGTQGQPQFASSGNTPTFAVDLTLLSDYFAARANRRFTTVALLLASAGTATDGWAVATNAPGAYFRYNGSGWDMHGTARFASASARDTALTAPAEGWKVYRTDTNMEQMHDGTRWRYRGSGLVPVIPAATSAAASGTLAVGASGAVTLTAATTATLRDVFTAEFENYRVMGALRTLGTPAAQVVAQLAVGATAAATAYDMQRHYANDAGAPAAARDTNTAQWNLNVGTGPHEITLELRAPQLAMQTQLIAEVQSFAATGGVIGTVRGGGTHRTATAYDSLVLGFGGTTTGKLWVYGWNNG